MSETALKTTPLSDLHKSLGAKMVPFAGYEMPVQYPLGVLKEHLHCRAKAGLFDVSHMGQGRLTGAGRAAVLEALTPGDFQALKPGRQRYTVFTSDSGGILDDLMVTNRGDDLFLVVNAACKDADFAHIDAHLAGHDAALERFEDRALLALQGPEAAAVLSRLAPAVADMVFMSGITVGLNGVDCFVTRSGYTGEDGYEISVPADAVEALARLLLDQPEVEAIGLGARDSLRLEAGLCLYGSDITTDTTPIEGDIAWVINKRRREEGGFPGADVILGQRADGAPRKRVGLRPEGRTPARAHTEIRDAEGTLIGEITSGGFSPSLEAPIAMGLVDAAHAEPGSRVVLMVRGKALPAEVVPMPFVPHRYFRG